MSEATALNTKYIVFELEDEEYAIPVDLVGSIERVLPITRVPGTPRFVKGVVNLRGVVTPVIDLKDQIKNQQIIFNEQTRIIITNMRGMTVGFIVDSANDVIDIVKDAIESPPETIGTEVSHVIDGVVKMNNRLFMLLNLDEILLQEDIEAVKVVEG